LGVIPIPIPTAGAYIAGYVGGYGGVSGQVKGNGIECAGCAAQCRYGNGEAGRVGHGR
jgi:hypothetical protein